MRGRWLANVVPIVAVVGIGLGGWQLIVSRSQLRDTRQQLAALRASDARQIAGLRATSAHQLAQARTKEQATESALATAQVTMRALRYNATTTTTTMPRLYVYENSSAQYGCSPVPVLTDETVLLQALSTAAGQLTGSTALPAGQQQSFVNQFWAAQSQQESNGAHGQAWSILDPFAQAGTFVQTNDQVDVIAAKAAAWAGVLNCMVDGGTNCAG